MPLRYSRYFESAAGSERYGQLANKRPDRESRAANFLAVVFMIRSLCAEIYWKKASPGDVAWHERLRLLSF
jgi:hypothetical protein